MIKKRILIFTDWYFPGYKAGGPIQSCYNLVSALKEDLEFYVLTSDRDLGDDAAYPGIAVNTWHIGPQNEFVFYSRKAQMSSSFIRRIILDLKPDVLYFNSMFSLKFTILPILIMKMLGIDARMVLAPRGMLQAGALSLKSKKKALFLKVFRLLQLNKKLYFHATDFQEKKDVESVFPGSNVLIVENIPNRNIDYSVGSNKEAGILKLVFYSRIHKKKNLTYILEVLKNQTFRGKIILDIYGDAESDAYMNDCIQLSQQLSPEIQVQFFPGGANDKIVKHLSVYDAFVLPTLGENFGHVIFESLMTGVPVLISDQTPWRNLSAVKAGWDIPLSDVDSFSQKLQELLDMDRQAHQQWREGARKHAERFLQKSDFRNKYISLFQ